MTTMKSSSASWPSLEDKVRVLQRADLKKWPEALGGAQDVVSESQVLNVK